MDKLFFEYPTIAREKQAIEYIEEHLETTTHINGVGGLQHVVEGQLSYQQWVEELHKRENKEYAYSIKRSPSLTLFLVRESDNKIVGMTNIRHDLINGDRSFGGNIGYGIRPSERRKGYNKVNLYLGLKKLQEFGVKIALLDCDVDNIGSNKTMQALGGVMYCTEFCEHEQCMENKYKFDVDEVIKIYGPIYQKQISERKG